MLIIHLTRMAGLPSHFTHKKASTRGVGRRCSCMVMYGAATLWARVAAEACYRCPSRGSTVLPAMGVDSLGVLLARCAPCAVAHLITFRRWLVMRWRPLLTSSAARLSFHRLATALLSAAWEKRPVPCQLPCPLSTLGAELSLSPSLEQHNCCSPMPDSLLLYSLASTALVAAMSYQA